MLYRLFPVLLILSAFLLPSPTHAQAQLVLDTTTINKAKVIDVRDQQTVTVPGTDTKTQEQTLVAEVLDGTEQGKTVTFTNDYTQLHIGETFYLRYTENRLDGTALYSVADVYRLPTLAILAAVFIALIFIFGGIQGVRGLASLCGSIILIFYLLIPEVYAGHSPILVSIGVASLIIVLGSYITHGITRTTTAAVLGMLGTVLITGLGAYLTIHAAHLSGFTSEENVYLNFDTRGKIDMVGLLFGGVMIGLLGVLYDIAISQAIAVEELIRAHRASTREVYLRAIRIGREHIGALVNTLAIAYVGASLPLLLLFQTSTTGILYMLNSELFATEIVRILVGSIGLILGVPITTTIAVYLLRNLPHAQGSESGHTAHHH